MALSQGRKARLEKVFWAAHMGTTYPRNETNSRPKSKGPYCTRAVCRGRPAPARNIPPGPKAKRPWQLLRTPRGERQPGPAYCGHRLLARAKLVPAQSPCAQCLERPKLKISESGSKKGLLTEKAPTEMGDLTFKFVSKKCRVQAFSMSGKEERGRAVFYKTQAASRIPQ